jgi:hypothetical protein
MFVDQPMASSHFSLILSYLAVVHACDYLN